MPEPCVLGKKKGVWLPLAGRCSSAWSIPAGWVCFCECWWRRSEAVPCTMRQRKGDTFNKRTVTSSSGQEDAQLHRINVLSAGTRWCSLRRFGDNAWVFLRFYKRDMLFLKFVLEKRKAFYSDACGQRRAAPLSVNCSNFCPRLPGWGAPAPAVTPLGGAPRPGLRRCCAGGTRHLHPGWRCLLWGQQRGDSALLLQQPPAACPASTDRCSDRASHSVISESF